MLEHVGLHQAASVLAEWLDRAAAQDLSYADFLLPQYHRHGSTRDAGLAVAGDQRRRSRLIGWLPFSALTVQEDLHFGAHE